MKKFIKLCAVTGLVLLVAGICVTSVSAALGGHYPHVLSSRFWPDIRDHIDFGNYWNHWDDDWDGTDNTGNGSGWTKLQENDLPETGRPTAPGAAVAGATEAWNARDGSAGTDGTDGTWTAGIDGVDGIGGNDAYGAYGDYGSYGAYGTHGAYGGGTAGAVTNGSGTTGAREAQGSTQAFNKTRKLSVDLDHGSLKIQEKQGISQIQINNNDKYNEISCYMDHDTLKVKRQTHKHWNDWNDNPKIEILVPEGYVFDKVSIDLGAAECTLDRIKTAKLDIEAGVGNVVFTGTVTGDVKLETDVGKITLNLSGRQKDYNYAIECGVGSIQVGNQSYSMLSHKTHINNNAWNNMKIECGVGIIQVNFDDQLRQ